MSQIILTDRTVAPTAPSAGLGVLYVKGNKLFIRRADGNEYQLIDTLDLPLTANTYPRRNTGNTAWVSTTPLALANELAVLRDWRSQAAIIDGNFDVWMGGASFTAPGYGATLWRHDFGSGAGTVSRQLHTLGQTLVPGDPAYFLRHARTSAAAAANTVQEYRIENVRTYAGKQVTVRMYLKALAGKTLRVDLVQSFGTGGSPSADVTITQQDAVVTTAFAPYTLTFTLPSITGKTLGTNANDYLALRLRETTSFTTFTLDIGAVQLDPGTVAPEFPFAPDAITRALRFFAKNYDLDVAPGSVTDVNRHGFALSINVNAGGSLSINVPFLEVMRARPAVTLYSPLSATVNRVESGGIERQASAGEIGQQGFAIVTNDSGVTWNDGTRVNFNYVADARL